MLPATTRRVERHTPEPINQARRREIAESERHYARHRQEIPARLDALDREWDIERALEANAAAVSLIGVGLAAFVDRRFLWLPAGVAGFLLQHALQGWCPPVPVMRRLGVRTPSEIADERCRLEALLRQGETATAAAAGAPAFPAEPIHEGVER